MAQGKSIADLLAGQYYKPTEGSMSFSLRQVDQLIGPVPDPPPDDGRLHPIVDDPQLQARVDAAHDKIDQASRLMVAWKSRKQNKAPNKGEGAVEADNAVDSSLGALHEHLTSYLRLSADHPLSQLAAELKGELLAGGVAPFTLMAFEDQHKAIEILVDTLVTEYPEHIRQLGLKPFVDELSANNDLLGRRLEQRDSGRVSWDQVSAARNVAREAFFAVVLTIWNNYLDNPDIRHQLLGPIEEQNDQLRRYYKRHSVEPDVDPDTGKFVDEDEPTPQPAEDNPQPEPVTGA